MAQIIFTLALDGSIGSNITHTDLNNFQTDVEYVRQGKAKELGNENVRTITNFIPHDFDKNGNPINLLVTVIEWN